MGKTSMLQSAGQKKLYDSDTHLVAAQEFCDLYHQLALKRNLNFASSVLDNALKANLGYSTTKLTLEATLALADQHPTNNSLELLSEAVSVVYALTPEKIKDERIRFIDALKSQPHLAMNEIKDLALRHYAPSVEDIGAYVASLPKEGHALILKSGQARWDELATTYPQHKDFIVHFSRIESQFKVRLISYMPA